MRLAAVLMVIVLIAAAVFQADHYSWFQKPRDMNNVRQQFHLPTDAVFVEFDSDPKSFLPEGLRVRAVIQFTDAGFAAYVSSLGDDKVWAPTALISYSPAIGESYSEQALAWQELPIPASVAGRLKAWHYDLKSAEAVVSGKFYCHVLEMKSVGRWEGNPNALKYKTFGRSCAELADSTWPTVASIGILDGRMKRLHVLIAFSG